MINLTPLLESCPLAPRSLRTMCLFSIQTMGGLNIKPSCSHGHQTRPLDTLQIHLRKADDGGV